MVEYWRWWVVHLCAEGFFEVFATTVIPTVALVWGRTFRALEVVPLSLVAFLAGSRGSGRTA